MKKSIIISILLTLIIIIYLISGSGLRLSESGAKDNNSILPRYVAAEGKVETLPGLEVDVGSEITGRIEKIYVNEGDRVKKGQLIAKLSNRDIEAKQKEAETELEVAKSKLREIASGSRAEEVKRAEANYEAAVADMELAKKNLERYESLFRDGVIPKAMLDERENAFRVASSRMKAAEEEKRLIEKGPKEETLRLLEDSVKKAEASVEYFKWVIEKTLITAPISGKVIHKNLFEGEMITEDFAILTIADVDKIRINAEVDETDIALIQIKDPVDITSEAYRGKIFKGEIEDIAGYAGERNIRPNNPAKNLAMKIIKVKIRLLEKTPFKLGMTVDVRIRPGK
ncbi:MAG: HlyD family secretion protein [Nitrospirae bacterium]|nr:HlyD family secretion protein [Nitrospirota bacterium]